MGTPLLPVGTQVVLRRAAADSTGAAVAGGATGRVAEHGPAGDYVVRLLDGRTVRCARDLLSVRKEHQHDVGISVLPAPDGHELVTSHTLYAAVVGSRAFGLSTEDSDTDVRGVYLAPTSAFWSLRKPPAHVEGPAPEQFSWELERCCELALKANPNVVEFLWSPLVLTVTPVGEELLALREAFLSKLAYVTFSGYALSQFQKIEADVRQRGEPRWKHVMHLLRLLLSVEHLLRTGVPLLDVGPHRERLLAVRRGEVSWADVERWRAQSHAQLEEGLQVSRLPEGPDTERVDSWLRSVRARSAREEAV